MWNDITFTSRDGLRLHARHYPGAAPGRRALICLAGLTRNGKDFHELALALTGNPRWRRDVYTIDSRGRGLSEHDPDWRSYTPLVEATDVLDFMTLMGLSDVAVLGSSRGGILAMVMGVLRPAALGALVLNDIGPEIELEGIVRMMSYVGREPRPASWSDAASLVRSIHHRQFPNLGEAQWLQLARDWYLDDGSRPLPGYDPSLALTLSMQRGTAQQPAMWPQFAALRRIPVLLLRGELTDLLSVHTVERMAEMHPHFDAVTIPGEGHTPLLRDQATIALIGEFLGQSDARAADRTAGPLKAVA